MSRVNFHYTGLTDNLPNFQSATDTVVTSFSLRKSKARDERDVKSRTKTSSKSRKAPGFIGLTVPLSTPSLNLLATPKGMAPPGARKVTYTPRRGALGAFVDTTKLSDREFELALANGLIKGRSRWYSVYYLNCL
ncbi:unnamed protein product [Strongylus vulgaris]|uniref:Uncharacterized protein n=1 Tax=Strongylus vulgaris TaxID=40348 RepID=A0A3P7IYY1_STRVU|nr:unnamed protein product [Strongylus vulgaris]